VIRKDNTDTIWMIYADYLDEVGEEVRASEIRDSIQDSNYNNAWCYEYCNIDSDGINVGGISVGSISDAGVGVAVGVSGVGIGVGIGVGVDGIGGISGSGSGIGTVHYTDDDIGDI
jgi:uncharacterized protein (TIGR02996 family)